MCTIYIIQLHATLIFGSRPVSPAREIEGPIPVYIEDISWRLSGSNDNNPIELPNIPVAQFRNYLLAFFGRPYDTEYSKLLTSYYDYATHDRDLCIRYLDIATVARRFGMTRLEEWAVEALYTIFTGPAESLARIASECWDSDTLLRLRAFTRNIGSLDLPISTFIQNFIAFNTNETTSSNTTAAQNNALACVGLYNGLKGSNRDPALLGCVFLNILALGPRSSVRGSLARNDRAIMYAAQVELIDVSSEFGSLEWLEKPGPGLHCLCLTCCGALTNLWVKTFQNCKKELGSGAPLKDVSLLAQLPNHRWRILMNTGKQFMKPLGCGTPLGLALGFSGNRLQKCTAAHALSYVDERIQNVYEEAAMHYKKFAEELF